MPISDHYPFGSSFELRASAEIDSVAVRIRRLYVLSQAFGRHMDFAYVSMARGDQSGVRGRLLVHRRGAKL